MDAKYFTTKQAYEKVLVEDRQEGIPYTAQKLGSRKEAQPGDEIGAVIAALSEQKAAAVTKLANDFLEIKGKKEAIDKELVEVKDKLQELDKSYFDAKDMAINRILQTATLTMKFAKIAEAATEKVESTDVPAVKKAFEKIAALIGDQLPDLKKQLDEILKETIKVKEEVKQGAWRTPTIQKENAEKLNEADLKAAAKKALLSIKSIGRKLKETIQKWTIDYDKKNNEIEDALNDLEAELGLSPALA